MIVKNKPRALIAHGGGPTAVLNASLAGVIDSARGHFSELYGARFGLLGVLNDDLPDLFQIAPERIAAMSQTPGSALGSTRLRLTGQDFNRIVAELKRRDIRVVFYTGGNGSMQTGLDLLSHSRISNFELQAIGIPKTIDNDLSVTHHSPGYASTAHFFACAARDAGADCKSLPSPVCLLETLGRNTGWIVAATSLARKTPDDAPHLIYLPERPVSLEKIASDVETVYRRLGYVVVSVCEGQRDENGSPFGADVDRPDSSVHNLASNLGHTLANRLSGMLGIRCRAEKPGLIGRSCGMFARKRDRREAYSAGANAVLAATEGHNGVMVALDGDGGTFLTSLESVARREKPIPEAWIAGSDNDVLRAFTEYATPLAGDIAGYPDLWEAS